jgi:3-hydroxyisobutyrate dehydrogenase-like beta-hydroxyacid dehydrogenase
LVPKKNNRCRCLSIVLGSKQRSAHGRFEIRIAIIGLGEVGRCYARGFAEIAGCSLGLCEPSPGVAASRLAEELGLKLHASPGPWLAAAEMVVSCVTGSAALDAFRSCLPHLQPCCEYADLTTANPADMRTAAAEAAARSVVFVDFAIVGGIALTGSRTPLLCAGRAGRRALDAFAALGAPVRVLESGEPGDAASLKLLRSIFTKGLEALAVECLMAAERHKVREELYGVLSDIDRTPLRDLLEMMLRTHVVHAKRRLREVEDAGRQLRRSGMPLRVQPAVRDLFAATADALDRNGAEEAPPTAEAALAWLLASLSPGTAPLDLEPTACNRKQSA